MVENLRAHYKPGQFNTYLNRRVTNFRKIK